MRKVCLKCGREGHSSHACKDRAMPQVDEILSTVGEVDHLLKRPQNQGTGALEDSHGPLAGDVRDFSRNTKVPK